MKKIILIVCMTLRALIIHMRACEQALASKSTELDIEIGGYKRTRPIASPARETSLTGSAPSTPAASPPRKLQCVAPSKRLVTHVT